jgi:hypothetical protein
VRAAGRSDHRWVTSGYSPAKKFGITPEGFWGKSRAKDGGGAGLRIFTLAIDFAAIPKVRSRNQESPAPIGRGIERERCRVAATLPSL